MAWSPEQIRTVREATFPRALRGYHPQDVERMRVRVQSAMERGLPLEDIDRQMLRRVNGFGLDPVRVDGFRTVISVWRATTQVADPHAAAAKADEARRETRERDYEYRWSSEQIDAVRERDLPLARRRALAYDVDDVNRYLESVIDAMRRRLEIPDPTHVRFDSSGMRRGYDPKPVDDFLEELAAMRPAE